MRPEHNILSEYYKLKLQKNLIISNSQICTTTKFKPKLRHANSFFHSAIIRTRQKMFVEFCFKEYYRSLILTKFSENYCQNSENRNENEWELMFDHF